MSKEARTYVSVFMAVVDEGKILLVKRGNTGFMDGYYDLPSGHVDKSEPILEAAVRELREETGLSANPDDLTLIHVGQSEYNPGEAYVYFMFKVGKWSGEPKNMEPQEHDDVSFFDLDNLPKTVPHILKAISNLDSEKPTFAFVTMTEEEFLRQ